MPCKDNITAVVVLFILLIVFGVYLLYLDGSGVFLRSHDKRFLALKDVSGQLQFVMTKKRVAAGKWRLSVWNKTLFNVKYQTLVYWQLQPEPLVNVYTGTPLAQSASFQQLPACPFYALPIQFGDASASYCVCSKKGQVSLTQLDANNKNNHNKLKDSCRWMPDFGPVEEDDSDTDAVNNDQEDYE